MKYIFLLFLDVLFRRAVLNGLASVNFFTPVTILSIAFYAGRTFTSTSSKEGILLAQRQGWEIPSPQLGRRKPEKFSFNRFGGIKS